MQCMNWNYAVITKHDNSERMNRKKRIITTTIEFANSNNESWRTKTTTTAAALNAFNVFVLMNMFAEWIFFSFQDLDHFMSMRTCCTYFAYLTVNFKRISEPKEERKKNPHSAKFHVVAFCLAQSLELFRIKVMHYTVHNSKQSSDYCNVDWSFFFI